MPTIHQLSFSSHCLKDNPLRDPHKRDVLVFAPDNPNRQALPVVFLLAGFTGGGRTHLNQSFGSEAMPQRLERLIAEGKMPPALFVFVDALTAYGGSQYLNSEGTGRYADYITQELVPFVDQHFKTTRRRALAGKSSGGFGALRLAMAHPTLFHAVACHSGDMHFELCYPRSFAPACRRLQKHKGSPKRFFADWRAMPKKPSDSFEALELIAMSAAYSPRARGGIGNNFDLPIDVATCTRIAPVWKRWLRHDPLQLLEQVKAQSALKSLAHLYLDCGTRDEFFLDFGARKFSARCKALGIAHDHQAFDDNHRDVSYRYDISLPRLVRALGRDIASR